VIPALRAGRDSDAAGFIALIAGCWSEFPGCIMDLDGEVPELRALASHYAAKGGALWAAEQDGAVVGMVATAPAGSGQGTWELGRMYVAPAHRGTGLAQALLRSAETYAAAGGATGLVLWSDTRFEAAHRFYERCGYVRQGGIRVLGDVSNSLEFGYAKPLGGPVVQGLDAAAATSAERALADLLAACLANGDRIGFAPGLSSQAALAFWRGVSRRVAVGGTALLVAWQGGMLAGTVQLDLEMPADQRHRAGLGWLLVHPAFRRHGLGRALMRRAEQAARAAARSLLTCDTLAGAGAEMLCRAEGWAEAGRIPDYVRDTGGLGHDMLLFYRQLSP
jgi:GNAT superfamily N-acetyltransferase